MNYEVVSFKRGRVKVTYIRIRIWHEEGGGIKT